MRAFFSFFKLICIIICIIIYTGCNQSEEIISKRAAETAENYISSNLENPQKEIVNNGIIRFSDSNKSYIIDPARIYTGLIDADNKTDAIVTIISFTKNGYIDLIEHLILLNTGHQLTLIRPFESDMRIIGISDHIITARMPKYPRSSPLFNCDECQDTVKYRYNLGDLEKVE